MKSLQFILLLVAFLGTSALISSCESTATTSKTEQQGKEYTSAYICPMHCKDSGSDAAGKCPVCGMDYVENDTHKADGHND